MTNDALLERLAAALRELPRSLARVPGDVLVGLVRRGLAEVVIEKDGRYRLVTTKAGRELIGEA